MMIHQTLDIPEQDGVIVEVGGELVLTIRRDDETGDWHILLEGDTDSTRDEIGVTITTPNEGESADFVV